MGKQKTDFCFFANVFHVSNLLNVLFSFFSSVKTKDVSRSCQVLAKRVIL